MKVTRAIILAGGRGTRLPEGERDKAKSLVEINGKPILAYQLEQLKRHGFKDICLALGYKADQVVAWLKKNGYQDVRYVVEREPMGTGGGIKNALGKDNSPFIALFGDIVADFNFPAIAGKSQDRDWSVLSGVHIPDVTGMGVLEYDSDNKVLAYKEKQASAVPGFINGNASLLFPSDFKDTPDKFSMELDFFPKLIRQRKLVLYHHPGFWFDCGTEDRLRKVREFFKEKNGK